MSNKQGDEVQIAGEAHRVDEALYYRARLILGESLARPGR